MRKGGEQMEFDYFYGPEDAEQYQFYRIPKLLIIGCSDLLPQILAEENAYAPKGSKVIIEAEEGAIDLDTFSDLTDLTNIHPEIRECRI